MSEGSEFQHIINDNGPNGQNLKNVQKIVFYGLTNTRTEK